MTSARPLHVAVVGSGPAGFYAADALLRSDDPPVRVDVIDRLPTPWGLVRLGVAPDHENIKAVSRAFEKTAAREGFRFFGNVEVGSTRLPRGAPRPLRRSPLHGRRPDRPPPRHARRGSARVVGGDRVRRLVQRPSRLPAPAVRPLAPSRRRDRERERRRRLRADARAHRARSSRPPTRPTRRSRRSSARASRRSSCSAAGARCRRRSRRPS